MRVLHVTPYFAPAFSYGGPPRSILGLCRALQRGGVDVEIVTTTADGLHELRPSPSEGAKYDGLPVRYFPLRFPRRMFHTKGLRAALLSGIRGYDLVHIHGLWNLPAWTGAGLARRTGVPYVLSPRGMLDAGSLAHRSVRKQLAYWAVERRNLAGAAFLHATSPAEAAAFTQRGFAAPVVMLPNGVDVPPGGLPGRDESRHRLGLPLTVPLVVFLGRVHPIKRLDLLAAAMDRVRGVCGDAHLAVAGPDENGHWREVQPLFARLGPAVHRLGELGGEDKWSLLKAADALVMCSDSESFGMSVAEAMAVGVPVVVTKTCPWEEVETERCGFWVRHDAEAIASGLAALLNHPARAREMGERGRVLVQTRYSWDSIGKAMAERYRAAASIRHYAVLTPGLKGTDGVSALSRLVVRAVRPARVLVLNDGISRTWERKLRFLVVLLRLAAWGRRYTDVLCLHVHLSPAARLLAGRGGRLTVFLHGIEAWKALSRFERWALAAAEMLMANSEHTARRFRQANPRLAARRVHVCHLGVRQALEISTRDKPALAALFALIVGRMAKEERYKGHDMLIEIWPRVVSEVPGAQLVIAGDGDDRVRLEAKAASIDSSVRFFGRVSDETLAVLYQQCSFFVMPSRNEGFGLVFLEAMRAGKACVGAVGAAAEIIEDEVTGLLVDPDDPEQVLTAVLRLFREPETRGRMGQAGVTRLAAQFTEEHFRRRFLALVEERAGDCDNGIGP